MPNKNETNVKTNELHFERKGISTKTLMMITIILSLISIILSSFTLGLTLSNKNNPPYCNQMQMYQRYPMANFRNWNNKSNTRNNNASDSQSPKSSENKGPSRNGQQNSLYNN